MTNNFIRFSFNFSNFHFLKHSSRLLLICSTLLLTNCSNEPVDAVKCSDIDLFSLNNTQQLFYDIAYNQEFGDDSERLRKWSSNISFFVTGSPTTELIGELNLVINQINNLNISYNFNEVENEADADLIIFFGTSLDYVELIQPEAAGFAEGSRGFTSIFWDSNFQIVNASICVDHISFPDITDLNHVIREELAQSLGLINDTVLDDSSIFHQFIQNQVYSDTDLFFIEEMLSNSLIPGMCPTEALDIIQ